MRTRDDPPGRASRAAYAIIAGLGFLAAVKLHEPFRFSVWYQELGRAWPFGRMMLFSAIEVAIVLLCVGLTHRLRPRAIAQELGLAAPVLPAFYFALICTVPMFVVYGLTSHGRVATSLPPLVQQGLTTPFAEEVVFRGYLFGQLLRRARLGFWPSALMVAALFGAGHAYQAVTGQLGLSGLIGVVAITGLGSALFSWLMVRWGFNVWVAVWMHGLMNLSWHLFAVDETALGGGVANAARFATVALAIALTAWQTKLPASLGKYLPPRSDSASPVAGE